MGLLRIVTGAVGSGKTTFVQNRIQQMRSAGKTVGGIVTEVRGDERWAINPADGSSWRLATPNDGRLARILMPRYAFDDEGIAKANEVLRTVGSVDLLVIDELGPLELDRGEGFTAALSVIGAHDYGEALIVVREALLLKATARWPEAEPVRVGISTDCEGHGHSGCEARVDVV